VQITRVGSGCISTAGQFSQSSSVLSGFPVGFYNTFELATISCEEFIHTFDLKDSFVEVDDVM